MKLVTAVLAALVLAGGAQARCHFLCTIRNPVSHEEFKHHVKTCTTISCEEVSKRREAESKANNEHVDDPVHHNTKPVYPCVIHWTYNAVRWWRYHYLLGGGINHVGLGPSGVRTCLPGQ